MKNKRFIFIVALVVLGVAILSGCNKEVEEVDGLKIYTTFYPLYDFTQKIGGDKVIVENMVPIGVEPHDFEPSPRQIANLADGDGFIFLGDPMDPWASKVASEFQDKDLYILEAGKGLIKDNDPHIWLDPSLSKEISKNILNMLISIDGDNKAYYRENFEKIERKFDDLDDLYRQELVDLARKDIVVTHSAFGYLADRYGLNQIAISGLSPQEEPTPKKMAELIDLVRERDIKYIFFEALASTKLADTLASEANTGLLVLNPLDGMSQEEMDQGKDYFSVMDENLRNLLRALK